MDADHDTALIDDHDVVIVGDGVDGDELAGLLGRLEGDDALAASVGDAVLLEGRALAVAILRHDEDRLLLGVLDADGTYDAVLRRLQSHAAHTG